MNRKLRFEGKCDQCWKPHRHYRYASDIHDRQDTIDVACSKCGNRILLKLAENKKRGA